MHSLGRILIQLASAPVGYAGYVTTIYGILGGGYSGEPIYWTRLEPYAGYRIVESAGRMLNRLWR